jgi:hypothetical protein
METASILLVGLRRLEYGLMHIRVKLLSRLTWVESLEAMFLERVDQDAVGHFDAVVQGNQVCIAIGRVQFLGRYGAEGAVQVVDGLDEVAGEALNGKVLCSLDFALGAFLQVAEVGDGAEVFVLSGVSISSPRVYLNRMHVG